MNDGYIVITGDFHGMRNIRKKRGDLLVLITGITRAITADHPIKKNPRTLTVENPVKSIIVLDNLTVESG